MSRGAERKRRTYQGNVGNTAENYRGRGLTCKGEQMPLLLRGKGPGMQQLNLEVLWESSTHSQEVQRECWVFEAAFYVFLMKNPSKT